MRARRRTWIRNESSTELRARSPNASSVCDAASACSVSLGTTFHPVRTASPIKSRTTPFSSDVSRSKTVVMVLWNSSILTAISIGDSAATMPSKSRNLHSISAASRFANVGVMRFPDTIDFCRTSTGIKRPMFSIVVLSLMNVYTSWRISCTTSEHLQHKVHWRRPWHFIHESRVEITMTSASSSSSPATISFMESMFICLMSASFMSASDATGDAMFARGCVIALARMPPTYKEEEGGGVCAWGGGGEIERGTRKQ